MMVDAAAVGKTAGQGGMKACVHERRSCMSTCNGGTWECSCARMGEGKGG